MGVRVSYITDVYIEETNDMRKLMLALTILLWGSLRADSQEIIYLQVAAQPYAINIIPENAFDAFEAAHPGVEVQLTADSAIYWIPNVWDDAEEFWQNAETYVSTADVIPLGWGTINEEMTRAGYLLDMMPLASADVNLRPEEFYPGLYEHYQWDGGLWALPLSWTPFMVLYQADVLNSVGLPLPSVSYTFEDFLRAAEVLDTGTYANPYAGAAQYMLMGGEMDNAILTERLTRLAESSAAVHPSPVGNFIDFTPLPVFIGDINVQGQWSYAPLPGNVYGANVYGVGVSGGTQYPELAYELARYVSQTQELSFLSYGAYAARSTLYRDYPASVSLNQIFDQIGNARMMTYPEQHYGDRLISAYQSEHTLDVIEQTVQEARIQADAIRSSGSLTVNDPDRPVELANGEIALRFGYLSYGLPNDSLWDDVIAAFIADDPQVGHVDMEVNLSPLNFSTTQDCFYLNYDGVDTFRVEEYYSLDPLMANDVSFDRSDFIGGTLEAQQLNGVTYGYPISFDTHRFLYQTHDFLDRNIPIPDPEWNMNDLTQLVSMMQDAGAPMPVIGMNTVDSSDLLALIAAYGGLPLDFRTSPPTVNFTEPQTINAIRQVLDMVRAASVQYNEIATTSMGMRNSYGILSSASLGLNIEVILGEDILGAVDFPVGDRYTPIVMGDVAALHISSSTAYPEACYRFITMLADHPELFSGMPARYSQVDNPALSPDLVGLYQLTLDKLSDPNVIVFNSGILGGAVDLNQYVLMYILGDAFDGYVMEDGDLESLLVQAQSQAETYLTCVAGGRDEVDCGRMLGNGLFPEPPNS